jgi:hypothetical protein
LSSACTQCTDGYYCQYSGQTEMEDLILEGYHANTTPGMSIPNPYRCPQAAYCPEGTYTPIPCANGYMATDLATPSDAYCITCPRGYFCNFYSMMLDGREFTYDDSDGSLATTTAYHGQSDSTVGTTSAMLPDTDYDAWRMASTANAEWRIG